MCKKIGLWLICVMPLAPPSASAQDLAAQKLQKVLDIKAGNAVKVVEVEGAFLDYLNNNPQVILQTGKEAIQQAALDRREAGQLWLAARAQNLQAAQIQGNLEMQAWRQSSADAAQVRADVRQTNSDAYQQWYSSQQLGLQAQGQFWNQQQSLLNQNQQFLLALRWLHALYGHGWGTSYGQPHGGPYVQPRFVPQPQHHAVVQGKHRR